MIYEWMADNMTLRASNWDDRERQITLAVARMDMLSSKILLLIDDLDQKDKIVSLNFDMDTFLRVTAVDLTDQQNMQKLKHLKKITCKLLREQIRFYKKFCAE